MELCSFDLDQEYLFTSLVRIIKAARTGRVIPAHASEELLTQIFDYLYDPAGQVRNIRRALPHMTRE